MKTKLHCYFCVLLVALALSTLNSRLSIVHAQGTTAFTYQGQLHDTGTNANGTYTMMFKLYDAATSGNQIGSTLTTSPTLVNGLFTVNLDFGNAFNGSARWLDITITNGGTTQELSPRVQVLPTPYAQFAAVAATVTNGAISATQIGNGAVVNAGIAANAVNGTNIATGQVVKSLDGLQDFVSLVAGANITLSTNGQILTIASTGGASGGTNYIPSVTYFQNNGTFIVPAGVTRILVEMWGGGGGGGGSYNDGSNSCTATGGGGGGGSYSKFIFNVTPGTSYPVTVGQGGSGGSGNDPGGTGGTGGTTSLGALISAAGGGGGGNAPNPCAGQQQCGNSGEGGSNNGNYAYLNIQGGDGQAGCDGGGGGTAALGGPGASGHGGGSGGGPGGGGGGTDTSNTTTAASGGSGANGLILIYY